MELSKSNDPGHSFLPEIDTRAMMEMSSFALGNFRICWIFCLCYAAMLCLGFKQNIQHGTNSLVEFSAVHVKTMLTSFYMFLH